jgi:hypothetical protein
MVASLELFRTEISSPNDEEFLSHKTGLRKEGQHIAQVLQNFNYETSDAWAFLTHHFSSGVRHRELNSIALITSKTFNIPRVTRDAQRSYPMLIKWFQDNWGAIEPILPLVSLRDENDRPIDAARESNERSER